jgi:membrane-bound ClpP family serine protease
MHKHIRLLFKFSLAALPLLAAGSALAAGKLPGLNGASGNAESGAESNPGTAASRHPFSINVTLGFPADISGRNTQPTSFNPTDSIKKSSSEPGLGKARVYEYGLSEESGTSALHHTSAAINQAINLHVDMIYIHLNTFADFRGTATDISNKLFEFHRPMTVFLDNGNNSSGAIISYHPDSVGSEAGSHVTTSVFKPGDKQFREKYKTYLNAAAGVSGDAETRPDLQEEVSTINPKRAVIHNAIPQSLNTPAPASNVVVYQYQPRFFEKALDFLLLPAVSFILILILLGGILFELYRPGTGFPLFASIGAALLLFTPLRIDKLANLSEIGIFTAGLVILVIRHLLFSRNQGLLVIALLLTGTGLTLSLCPDFELTNLHFMLWKPFLRALLITGSGAATLALLFYWARTKGYLSSPDPRTIPERAISAQLS